MVYSMEDKNKRAGQALLDTVSPVSPGPDYNFKSKSIAC